MSEVKDEGGDSFDDDCFSSEVEESEAEEEEGGEEEEMYLSNFLAMEVLRTIIQLWYSMRYLEDNFLWEDPNKIIWLSLSEEEEEEEDDADDERGMGRLWYRSDW